MCLWLRRRDRGPVTPAIAGYLADLVAIERRDDASLLARFKDGTTLTTDCVFFATGRRPMLDNLGIENTAVERDERGQCRYLCFVADVGGLPPEARLKREDPNDPVWGLIEELVAQGVEEVSLMVSQMKRRKPLRIPRPWAPSQGADPQQFMDGEAVRVRGHAQMKAYAAAPPQTTTARHLCHELAAQGKKLEDNLA